MYYREISWNYLEMAAKMPAAHIIQVWDPNPYHINCSISKSNPTMMVCLLPKVFIKQVSNPVWAKWKKNRENIHIDKKIRENPRQRIWRNNIMILIYKKINWANTRSGMG